MNGDMIDVVASRKVQERVKVKVNRVKAKEKAKEKVEAKALVWVKVRETQVATMAVMRMMILKSMPPQKET